MHADDRLTFYSRALLVGRVRRWSPDRAYVPRPWGLAPVRAPIGRSADDRLVLRNPLDGP
ncbi:hypothetical protein EV383_2485 [Pseudonocardia sediminis]|uniref:Uncharacterized protein n=1 Tax=Pseudonocardia sediminis TaxID=1397368 RepID=A0A4V2FQP9_PSEST|nr:hypothetical protein EV383_2485 [Pseudonocardia sediminis]